MKGRQQIHGSRSSVIEVAPACHTDSLPNSSAVLAVTVLADVEGVLAVIRTAALLGRSFKATTSVNLFGEDAIQVECDECNSDAPLERHLSLVRGKLSELRPSESGVFAVEVGITAASFLTIGAISVLIRHVERPVIAR